MNTPDSLQSYAVHPRPTRAPRADRAHRGLLLKAQCCLASTVFALFLIAARDADTAEAAAPAQVSMRNVQFEPARLEVKKGTAVTWKNDDLVPHTATSPQFDSGSLATGESWRHTFTQAGVFSYVCTFHPHMKGVVVVK
jgi:plastocyanin